MRCYICDAVLDKPIYNGAHGDYDPCKVCLDVINALFNDEEPEGDSEENEEDSEKVLDNLDESVYNIS